MSSVHRGERRGSFSGSAASGGAKANRSGNQLFIVGAAPSSNANTNQHPQLLQVSQQQQNSGNSKQVKVPSRTPPAWLSGRSKQGEAGSDKVTDSASNPSSRKSKQVIQNQTSQNWMSNKSAAGDDETSGNAVQASGRYASLSAFIDFDTEPVHASSSQPFADELSTVNSMDYSADFESSSNIRSSRDSRVATTRSVLTSPLSSTSKLRLVELRRIIAARCIQRWWLSVRENSFKHYLASAHARENSNSNSTSQNDEKSVEKLLEARRRAAMSIRASSNDFVGELRAAQRNAVEEKAREQRRRAIETLHEKRAEQRNRDAEIANAELQRIMTQKQQRPKTASSKQQNHTETESSSVPSLPSDTSSAIPDPPKPETLTNNDLNFQDKLQSKTTLNDLLDTLRLLEEETSSSRAQNNGVGTAQNPASVSSRIVGELDALIAEAEETKANLSASIRQVRPITAFTELPPKAKRSESATSTSRSNVSEDKQPNEEPRKRTSAPASRPPTNRKAERTKLTDRSKPNSQRGVENGAETQRSEASEGNAGALWGGAAQLEVDLDALAERERASRTASVVSEKLLTMQIELDERTRECEALKRALAFQRELTVRNASEAQRDAERQLATAKRELEEANKRHVSFIDQLIEDKKTLADRCESLIKEMRTLEQRAAEKFRLVEERHTTEMRKLKEVHEAAEKLRREKWIDEQTKRIKQLTVRGLEPEIEKLVTRHKDEIRRIRAEHEAALADADQRAAERFQLTLSESRLQFERERSEAVERERRIASERAEKQVRDELEAVAKQRERLTAEAATERERQAEMVAKQKAELDRERSELQKAHADALSTLKREFDEARADLEARTKREKEAVSARLETEQRAFFENELRKKEAEFAKREAELKERFRSERDREIELAIERLERDSASIKSETERIAEQKYKRLREKYELEIKELEEAAKQTSVKQNEFKTRCVELEGENDRLKVQMRQREKEIDDIRKMFDTLNRERDHVGDIVRQEFADRIVQCEEDNKRLKAEMSEMRAKQAHELMESKKEVEKLRREKEQELEEIHLRVKTAMTKKEEVVAQLKKEYEQAVKRADHLEELLNQQRQTILQSAKKT